MTLKKNTAKALVPLLATSSALVAAQQIEAYGRPVKQDSQMKAADPVKHQMQ